MGDTMREATPAAFIWRYANGEEEVVFVDARKIQWDPTYDDCPTQSLLFDQAALDAAHEAGRQLGMEQARREPLTDAQIESQCRAGGARWSGDHWVIEDADLHPLIRSFIPTPPAGDSDTKEN